MEPDRSELLQGQTLTDHLSELRDRLVRSVWAVGTCSVVAWFYKEELFALLRRPIEGKLKTGSLVFLGVVDPFMVYLKIAIATGIAVSTPVWLYQAWRFIAPGLYAKEKRYGLAFIFSGTALFVIGVLFAYFLVLPTGLEFFIGMATTPGVQPMFDVSIFLGFVTMTSLIFGLAFELPLALTLLGLIGVIDQEFLRQKRRIAIVVMATLAAFVTPPDALSMLMLLVPMTLLYELSIFVVGMLASKKSKG